MQGSDSHRDGDQARPVTGKPGSSWDNVALLLVSLLSSLVLIEIGYRLIVGLPAFELANWRIDNVIMANLGELNAVEDPDLGWTNAPSFVRAGGSTTIEYGVRKNFDETTIRTGGMLAVGDSFTEGWEVEDHQSWPAVLERMTGVPVVNAAVGGYGADQSIMRAEQMLPVVRPKVLLVGLHEIAIGRVGYSIYGAPKPYFTLENGEPHYHPAMLIEPRDNSTLASTIAHEVRDVLGHSAVADYLFARLNPNFWYGDGTKDLQQKTNVDEVALTCALLKRLKAQADMYGIRVVVVLQHYATLILSSDKPGPHARGVAACAPAMGIRVVDQFASLRPIVVEGPPNVIRDYYRYHDRIGVFGHMTAKGNEDVANLVHAALSEWLPAILGWSPQTRAMPAPAPTGTLQP